MNLAGFFLAFTVHGVANCVLRGRRSIWHSFALCSAVKFWRAVALEVAFFSVSSILKCVGNGALFGVSMRLCHCVFRCGGALFC